MKFTLETEDEKEALMYLNAPKFYMALHEIRDFLRNLDKYGYALTPSAPGVETIYQGGTVSDLRQKINEIIDSEAPYFHEVI